MSKSTNLLLIVPAFFFAIAYVWLAYWAPVGIDSGVYIHAGRVVGGGGIPYVDFWDHKGPLLYVLSAAGLTVGGGSVAGVFLLEGALVTAAVLVSTHIWAKLSGAVGAALVGIALLLSYLALFEHGAMTETWLFPFTLYAYTLVAGVLVTGSARAERRLAGAAVALGIAGAIAGLTRINNGVGPFLAALILMISAGRHWPQVLLGLTAGFALIVAPTLVWLVVNGAGPSFVEQYLLFNLIYSSSATAAERLDSGANLVQAVLVCALVPLVVFLAGVSSGASSQGERNKKNQAAMAFLAIAAADLSSQLLSGLGFLHYAVIVLPALAVSAVLLLPGSVSRLAAEREARLFRGAMLGVLLAASSLGAARAVSSLLAARSAGLTNPASPLHMLATQVDHLTRPSDRILLLGAETAVLAVTGRSSATRMSYDFPLTSSMYRASPEVLMRHVQEAKAASPALVIRWAQRCGYASGCPRSAAGQDMDHLQNWVDAHYRVRATIAGRELLSPVNLHDQGAEGFPVTP